MNQAWIERTQRQAIRTRYREPGHTSESPTEYYIRKFEIMSLVYNFTPSQIMSEILLKAPRLWSTIINPRSFTTLAQFQTAIKYHEDLLIELGERFDDRSKSSNNPRQSRSYRVDPKVKDKNPFRNKRSSDSKPKESRSYAVGWNNDAKKPQHPKDDSNVSKGKTPADYGARGCVFCGSTKHWDRECKYNSGSALRKARTFFTEYSYEGLQAEAEYERCSEESQQNPDEENTAEPDSNSEDQTQDHSDQDSDESDFC